MSIQSSFPAEAPRATLLDHEPGRFYAGHFRNISMVLWEGGADGPSVMRMRHVSQHLIRSYPGGHSNITFVVGGVPPPTEEARVAFMHIFDGKASDLRCMAIVLEGDGFWASALRSTVTSMRQAAMNTFAVRLFSTSDAVIDWLPEEHTARTGVEVNGPDLKAAIKSLRHDLIAELQGRRP